MNAPSDENFECGRCGCFLIIFVTILVIFLIIVRPTPPHHMKKKTAELVPVAPTTELVEAPAKTLKTLNGKTVLNLNPSPERIVPNQLYLLGGQILDTDEPREVRVVQL